MIPDLCENGYLPVGRYLATSSEVKTSFVNNNRREVLWKEFVSFAEILRNVFGEVPHLWIGGSFLSSKENPGDIDVIAVIHEGMLEGLSPAGLFVIDTIAKNKTKNVLNLQLDTFVLSVSSPNDASMPAAGTNEAQYFLYRGYWDNLWSATRSKSGLEPCTRGYLEVICDERA